MRSGALFQVPFQHSDVFFFGALAVPRRLSFFEKGAVLLRGRGPPLIRLDFAAELTKAIRFIFLFGCAPPRGREVAT